MHEFRIVVPYYENPTMLERQVANWNRYAGELRQNCRIIVVDDHSTQHPAAPIFEACKAPKTLLRFTTPGLWTQHEARNLGAQEAGKGNPWLFMTDIDMMLTPEMAYSLFEQKLEDGRHYTVGRVLAPDMAEEHYHCNTFAVKRSHYWTVNGYDVDFCGLYGGGYGGDGEFVRQLNVIAPRFHLSRVHVICYGRSVIADASTTQWDRVEWKEKYRRVFDAKRKTGDMRSKNPIRRQWEKVF